MVYVGIDEAGYGPMLGPLCVGACALRVESGAGEATPDLFEKLSGAVCRDLRSWRSAGRRPVVIGDSKKLKLPNDSKHLHPLYHLERGVLSVLRSAGHAPADDGELRELLGSPIEGEREGSGVGVGPAWYAGEPIRLPLGESDAEIAIAGNVLASAFKEAGAELAGLWCRALDEGAFNEVVERTGTKASATAGAIAGHLRAARDRWGGESVRVVCDRLGGRTQYAGVLRRALSDGGREVSVETIEERSGWSRYRVEGDGVGAGDAGDWQVLFLEDSEDAHLPVALASMTAKLVRELAMKRFNRYWAGRAMAAGFELKPTAGYVSDARRWLAEIGPVLEPGEREAMVRRS